MRSPGSLRGMLQEHGSLLNAVLHVVDWLVVATAGWLAYWIYLGGTTLPSQYLAALVIGVLGTAVVFPRIGVYRAWRGRILIDELGLLVMAWLVVVMAMVVLAFLTKTGATFSRVWLVLWASLGTVGLVTSRMLLRSLLMWLRTRGYNLRRVVIVGTGEVGREVGKRLSSAPWTGLTVTGFFGVGGDHRAGDSVEGFPFLGTLSELPAYTERAPIDQVWLALPLKEEDRIRETLDALRNTTVDIRLVPDLFGARLIHHSLTDIAGLPVMNLSVSPMEGLNRLIKAFEDRILASLILILIGPLLLLIAIAVRLDSPGPILFRQRRHGWDGRPIEIWKFRSMHVHEETGQYRQATRDDPRVTRVGAFLRRTSLDELPQFINVLQGRMSIVGPRPHPIQMDRMYCDRVDGYMRRHKVKPGITGWAQVNGLRGETETMDKIRRRIEYDLYYIENWSLAFDLRIILMTLFSGFVHRNAY